MLLTWLVVLIISSSAHFMAQISENSLRSSSRSISLARLSAAASAMKAWYSSSVGKRPVMSIVTRRRNSSSVHSSLGRMRSLFSFAPTSSSM